MTHTEPDPIWNPDDHLDRVYRRGRQLRRRRLAGFGGAAAVVAVSLLALAVSGNLTNSNNDRRVLTSGQSALTTTTSAPAPTATTGPAVTVTTASPSTVTSPTTVVTATTAKPTVTTAPATQQPTTTTATTAGCLTATTVTDKASYGLNQAVTITMVVQNRTSAPCTAFGPSGIGAYASVLNSSGVEVWRNYPIGVACSNPCPPPPVLAPGQSHNYLAGEWTASTSGSFQAVAHHVTLTAAPAGFTVG